MRAAGGTTTPATPRTCLPHGHEAQPRHPCATTTTPPGHCGPSIPQLRSPPPWRGQPVSPPPPATPPPSPGSQPLFGGGGCLCACLPLPAVPRTARRLYTRRLPTRLHRTHDNPTVTNHKDSFAMGRAPGVDARGHHAAGQGEASGGGGSGTRLGGGHSSSCWCGFPSTMAVGPHL